MPYSAGPMSNTNSDPAALSQALIGAGQLFHARGWVPATGGNFSARLGEARMLITASGCHKGELAAADFLVAGLDGKPIDSPRKASYETLLHCQLYLHEPRIGAALHTHSVANTVLSMRHDCIRLQGYELLKLLPGIATHDVTVDVPVFENDQDIPRLAAAVDAHMKKNPRMPAYVIRGHGLYAWGESVAQARWRVEALEFMFECELRAQR